jgi:hypothetical protein
MDHENSQHVLSEYQEIVQELVFFSLSNGVDRLDLE